jgi:hypothetical protein
VLTNIWDFVAEKEHAAMGFVLDSPRSFLQICDRQHVVSNRLQYVFAKRQKLRQCANKNDFWFEFVQAWAFDENYRSQLVQRVSKSKVAAEPFQGALGDKHSRILWYIPRTMYSGMQGEAGERWRELRQQAAVEQDASKLLRLVTEINQLLEAKEQRLHARKQGAWNLLCDPVAQPRRAPDSFQSAARSRSASCRCIAVVVSDLWARKID